MRPCLVLGMLLLSSHSGASSVDALTQLYQDARTGLAIHYPAGWRLDPKAAGFAIIDFPLNQRPPQVLVPTGRAEIGIFAPPDQEKTIGEWMRSDRIAESHGDQIAHLRLRTRHLGTLEVIAARSEPTVIPDGTLLIYFFEIGGRPIKASLIYRGRSKAAHFEDILRSMIEDLETAAAR